MACQWTRILVNKVYHNLKEVFQDENLLSLVFQIMKKLKSSTFWQLYLAKKNEDLKNMKQVGLSQNFCYILIVPVYILLPYISYISLIKYVYLFVKCFNSWNESCKHGWSCSSKDYV